MPVGTSGLDLPQASAGSDMIRWSRVLLGRTLDTATAFWWCGGRVLLSGPWYGADSYREPVSLPDASGMSVPGVQGGGGGEDNFGPG